MWNWAVEILEWLGRGQRPRLEVNMLWSPDNEKQTHVAEDGEMANSERKWLQVVPAFELKASAF